MQEVIVYEKINTWLKHRVLVSAKSQEEALDKVTEICKRDGVDGLFGEIPDMEVLDSIEQCELEESILPSDNNGCATIEVMEGNGGIYWDNAENS